MSQDRSLFSRLRPLMLAGAAAAALAACAHKPPPPADTGMGGPPPPPPPPAASGMASDDSALPPPAGMQEEFASRAGGDRVYFEYDQSTIKPEAQAVLDGQAGWLRAHPGVNARVEGAADERGTREYNLALGERRADAVRDYLSGKGIAAARLTTVSYGKERPIDTSGTEEGMAKNRNAHTQLVGR